MDNSENLNRTYTQEEIDAFLACVLFPQKGGDAIEYTINGDLETIQPSNIGGSTITQTQSTKYKMFRLKNFDMTGGSYDANITPDICEKA